MVSPLGPEFLWVDPKSPRADFDGLAFCKALWRHQALRELLGGKGSTSLHLVSPLIPRMRQKLTEIGPATENHSGRDAKVFRHLLVDRRVVDLRRTNLERYVSPQSIHHRLHFAKSCEAGRLRSEAG